MLPHQHQTRTITIKEGSSMMQDVVHKKKKKWKHSDNEKKKHSFRSLDDDVPETATVGTDQEVQNPRLAGHSEKKRKKKKKDRSTSLGGCGSPETVMVDTEEDLQNLQYVGGDEKKRKKKEKERHNSRSEGACADSEVQNPRLAGHSEEKQKKKKKDRSTSLGGCGSPETVMVDTEEDLQNLQYVGGDEKKRKKKEKERHNSRSEGACADSEVQNPRLAGHSEEKQKKKKKDRSRSLGGCDSSETVAVDTEEDLQNLQYVCDDEKKRKEKEKERHNSRSEGACADSEVQNPRLVGDGEKKRKKHHPWSAEGGDASQTSTVEIEEETQHSRLMGNEGNQKNKKKHRSRLAEEAGISESAVKTKQKLQSARLVDSGVKKKDHVKAVKDDVEITAKETPQAMQNPKLVGGKDSQKKRRKHCSSSAEDGGVSESTAVEIMQQMQSSTLVGDGGNQKRKKHHYRSVEGGNDSETAAKDPRQESEISESADIDTETSTTKHKKKKKTQFEIDINRDVSLSDSEIPQQSIKKRKISRVLPFETVVEGSLDESFKKHKVKCSPGAIAENRATNHSKAVKDSNFAEITAEQTEQTMHNSSTGCQETVKTSKRFKQKKGSLSGFKKSGRTKNLRQDRPVQCSALSTENTFEVVITPETITELNKSLETRKRQKKKQQHMPESDNKDGSTAVEHFQEEAIPFSQNTTEVKMMQKSQLVEVLKDFIPNAEKLATETAYRMYKYDLPRFKRFKEEGIPIRQGRFTKEENQQLQKNLKDLMELTGIQNEWELLHVPESFNEMMRIKQLKMTEGIPRPWKCVYQRAKKMYDPNRCKGRYTIEELEKLKRLQIVHGNCWKKIAELMDRSDESVRCRARTVKSSLNIGPWSKKEKRTLMQIMEQVMKSRIEEAPRDLTITASNMDTLVTILREKLYKGIPWVAIADQMEHRNWLQCRQKWMTILTTKMSGGVIPFGFNGCRTKINLIKRLYLLNVDDVGDVDWEELCSTVGDVPPIFIQRMFYRLKTRYVPDWSKKSFGGIVDFLYEQIIPKMEAVLQKKKSQDNWVGVDGMYQPQQRVFKLSDIFDDDYDDEEDEIETIHPLEEHTGTSLQTPVGETD